MLHFNLGYLFSHSDQHSMFVYIGTSIVWMLLQWNSHGNPRGSHAVKQSWEMLGLSAWCGLGEEGCVKKPCHKGSVASRTSFVIMLFQFMKCLFHWLESGNSNVVNCARLSLVAKSCNFRFDHIQACLGNRLAVVFQRTDSCSDYHMLRADTPIRDTAV